VCVEDALGPRACRGGVVAEDLRARGGVLRHGGAVGPVGRREREPPAHRRRVVVGQVVVDRARCDGPGSGEGEGGERVRVVECGDLGDHPADADARQVRGPVVESAGERGGIGGEIPQRVPRRLGVDGRRRAGVAQVVAHDVTSAASERLAERVGPGEHGRAAREQHEGRCRIAEVLDPERDTAGRAERVDRRMRRIHRQPPGQLRDRAHATREPSPATSAPAPTQGSGQSAVRSRDQSLRLRRLQLANGTPPSGCRAITHLHRRPPAVEVSDQVDTDYDAKVPCAALALVVAGTEQGFAVVVAKQEREPSQVGLELAGLVGRVTDETPEGCVEMVVFGAQPVMEKAQEFSQLGRVPGVHVHSGHGYDLRLAWLLGMMVVTPVAWLTSVRSLSLSMVRRRMCSS
jgi:hypothetical protein